MQPTRKVKKVTEKIPKNSTPHVLPRYDLKDVFGNLRTMSQEQSGRYVLEKHVAWINGSMQIIHEYLESGRISKAKAELEEMMKYIQQRKHWE